MKLILSISALLLTLMVHAGGFQLNLQGVRSLGMGHTGMGLHYGPSALFFNPGAAAMLDQHIMVTADVNILRARTLYTEPTPGQYYAYNEKLIGTPFSFYATWQPKDVENLTVGIAIYTPFGSRVQYADDWQGQFLLREMSLKTIFVQPTLSYKVSEQLGVGIGFVYGMGDFSLRRGVPTQNQNEEYGEGVLAGSGSGIGFNFGAYYQVNEKLSLGTSFRSSIEVKVDGGTADFTVPESLSEYFPSTTFQTGLDLPYVGNIGLAYSTDKYTITADVNLVGWSVYDSLTFDFAENTDKLEDIRSARHYENAPIFRIGAEYKLNDMILVRAGAYYDMTPVQDGYLTPETPDANKIGITGGASYSIGEKFSVDIAVLYIEGQERFDTNLETEFSGSWKARAWCGSLGLNLKL